MKESENIKESTIGFHHETQQLNNSIDEITEFYNKQVLCIIVQWHYNIKIKPVYDNFLIEIYRLKTIQVR